MKQRIDQIEYSENKKGRDNLLSQYVIDYDDDTGY